MNSWQISANIFSYIIFSCSPFIAWFSRKNIPAILQIPFVFTAYVFPILIFPFDILYSEETLDKLTSINIIGAFALIAGIVVSKFLIRGKLEKHSRIIEYNEKKISAKLILLLAPSVIGIIFCFFYMGMVPAFAENPFDAKFFKGQYKDKYEKISIIYRLCQFSVITLLPIAIAAVFDNRKAVLISLVFLSVTVLGLSLTRAPVFQGALLFAAVIASSSRKKTIFYLIATSLIYTAGSFVYIILGLVNPEDSDFGSLSFGAPDVLDHLNFLTQFNPATDTTWGATFVGGLVPGNYKYNPSIYSLVISNGTDDVSQISSGGFRMPPSIWGFISFGWYGVVGVCFMSGLITGIMVKKLKGMLSSENRLTDVISVVWYQVIASFWIGFFTMYYYGIISILVFLFVVRNSKKYINKENEARVSNAI